jgi:hypothetical protein
MKGKEISFKEEIDGGERLEIDAFSHTKIDTFDSDRDGLKVG